MTRIAYCRDCKRVIAVGDFRKKALPSHREEGKIHDDVGLLDVPDVRVPLVEKTGALEKFLDLLTRTYKNKFK